LLNSLYRVRGLASRIKDHSETRPNLELTIMTQGNINDQYWGRIQELNAGLPKDDHGLTFAESLLCEVIDEVTASGNWSAWTDTIDDRREQVNAIRTLARLGRQWRKGNNSKTKAP
jgi:hypothetical protein